MIRPRLPIWTRIARYLDPVPYADHLTPRLRRVTRALTTGAYVVVASTGVVVIPWAWDGRHLSFAVAAAVACATVVAVLGTFAAYTHARQQWLREMNTIPWLSLGLLGYLIESGLFRPWYPGGTLFAQFVLLTLLGLAARGAYLHAEVHQAVKVAEQVEHVEAQIEAHTPEGDPA